MFFSRLSLRYAARFPLLLAACLLFAPGGSHSEEFDKAPLSLSEAGVVKGEGVLHTWKDGDKIRKVWLQPGLTAKKSTETEGREHVVARSGDMIVVRDQGRSGRDSGQVFLGESGQLMMLPGGILLVFGPEWDEEETSYFFVQNGIDPDRVSGMSFAKNAFFVETEPGLAALELANELAGRDGVIISSPNWQTEVRAD